MAKFFPRLRAGYIRFTTRAIVVMRKASEQLNGLLAVGLIGLTLLPFNALTAEKVLSDLELYGQRNELGCLALNLYRERATKKGEGQNEPDEGLLAIGWVVKNRLAIGFRQKYLPTPQTICDVVWAGSTHWLTKKEKEKVKNSQFSWTDWEREKILLVQPDNVPEFVRAFELARAVLREEPRAMAVRHLLGPADHYYNPQKVRPEWSKDVVYLRTVGFHEFYVEEGRFKKERRAMELALGY